MIDTAQAARIDAHVERTGDVARTHAAVGDGAPGADGGPSLGERKEGEDAFIAALVEYGRLQRRLEGCVEEMLALGVADMRPAVMPDRFHVPLARGRIARRGGGARARGTSSTARATAMLVPLGLIRHRSGEAELRRARDAYLGVFADRALHAELVETLEGLLHDHYLG